MGAMLAQKAAVDFCRAEQKAFGLSSGGKAFDYR